ncbi:MAG: cell division protein ZapA [Prevotella sp.]|nr:cell division protein ZapA [Prevotella sp.]MBR0275286.1 cell division protein ZapA [Prevotella sp.]
MAEEIKEKLNIRLHVYDEDIHATIEREDEEYYRAAAKLISERYGAYAQVFKGRKSDHTIALMTLIEIALRYEKEVDRNDTSPYDNILLQLTNEIEEAMKD